MNFIRNILALIGLLAIVAAGYAYTQYGGMISQMGGMLGDLGKVDLAAEKAAFEQLDGKAKDVYMGMWEKLKKSGNSADATVVVHELKEGVSPQDAEEAMKMVANEHNIKAVGELPLSNQVELETGQKQRFLKIFQYCNPQTAMKMVEYSDAFAAYLPCRIAMVEGKDGKYRLYALDMDMMIHGGKTLPPELYAEADKVRTVIYDIMKRGAAGDF